MAEISLFSVEDFNEYLKKNFPRSVLESFQRNEISGNIFLLLEEEELKELVPVTGQRIQVRELLRTLKNTQKSQVVAEPSTPLPENEESFDECHLNSFSSDDSEPDNQSNSKSPVTPIPNPKVKEVSQPKGKQLLKKNSTKVSFTKSSLTNHKTDWLDAFYIPEKPSFSISVQQSIESGIISSKARSEIIRVLRTLILQHTQRPNHIEYETVCRRLIEKYEMLKDSLGSGWGSWKLGLRNSFKNFRRNPSGCKRSRSPEPGVRNDDTRPSKRLNLEPEVAEDDEEYEEAVSELKVECSKSKKK